jgi:hypothetical protein
MPSDPLLAHIELLAVAAVRVKQRRERQPDPYPVVWLTMTGEPEDPDAEGPLWLPRKCATAEEWYHSRLIAGMRARLTQPGESAC